MKRFSIPLLLFSSTPAYADDGLILSGSTRIRYEIIDGQLRTAFNESDDLLNIRTIVTGEYRTGRLRLGAELYDSRVYGGDAGTLWLASRFDSFSTTGVRDATDDSGTFAGHQLEERVRYWLIPKSLRLEWNGLLLAKGRFLHDAPNVPRSGDALYNSSNATVSF